MIWTRWLHNVYTLELANTESGTMDGQRFHEKEPITPPMSTLAERSKS